MEEGMELFTTTMENMPTTWNTSDADSAIYGLENALSSADASGALGIFAGATIGLFLFLGIILILVYIFESIGLYKIAKRSGENAAWLAWIPVANSYIMGKVGMNSTFGWVLLGLTIATSCFSGALGALAGIVGIAGYVCTVIALHGIYKKLSTKSTVMTVFTAIFIFLYPIFLFAIRNNEFIGEEN